MNKCKTLTAILTLMLLVLPAALRAADSFSVNPVNIVPGTEKTISISLTNSQQYYGFQTDLILPEGLTVVSKTDGSLDISLTDRAASSFSLSANEISAGTTRMVCFSSQHVPFTGSSGVLLKIRLKASDTFSGGQISLSNTIFSNSQNKDVRLADSKIMVSTREVNVLSTDNASIDAGEGKYIPVILNNETEFTAYQFDVNLPEGLSIDFNLTKKTERCTSGHQLSYNQLSDGKVRFVCYSTNNDLFTGNGGAILNLWIKAARGATGSKQVTIDNIVFSSANAATYRLDPCTSNIVIKYTPVTSISLDKSSASLLIGETLKLQATVLPTDASNKAVTWHSDNYEIATVDNDGLVTAKKYGSCVISAMSSDGQVKAGCNITVNRWPLQVRVNNVSRQYGEDNPSFTFSYTGFQGSDSESTLQKLPVATTAATAQSAVGNYDIVASGAESEKYDFTYVNGSLTVTKAPLTISAGNYTKKQGAPMPEFKASYQGFRNNEAEDVLTKKPVFTTTATEASAPGNYEVTVSGAEAQNYDISYQPGTLTVTEADAVIITAKSYSRTYGDSNPTFEYEVQGAQLDGVPEITCEATKNSPVGTYTIVVKQGTVKNYNVIFANGTLTVTKAPLTISAGNYTKKQGDPMPTFKAVYNGFKNNETEDVLTKKPVFTTTATEASAPGNYEVTVSGAEAQNYDISYQPGTLTVTEADAVIITAKSYSRVYGDNNPTFEYEVQGAQLDGVPEITCEATKDSPVGTYAIVVKQGTVKNYNVTFANGTLTVTKAPLTISAGNYTKKQGDPMPEFKAGYQGFKNNDTEDVLTKKPVITTTATETSAPGDYEVTVSGAEARNYDISYQPGTLTIIEDVSGISNVSTETLSIKTGNHFIYLEGANVGSILNVYDLSGNKCMSVRITSDKADINCNVPNGVYVVRIGNVSKKVVL